jgi:Flp pilus assembly protein TadG
LQHIFKLFATNRSGNVAILFALTSLVMFSVVGIAIDYGRAVHARGQLQSAADAAALAAASKSNLSDDERLELAAAIFSANSAGSNLVAGVEPNIELVGSGDASTIEVRADTAVGTTFAGVAGISSLPISVVSTAQMGSTGSDGPNGPACVLALEPSDYGIKINGGGTGSHLTTDCNVHVNSTSSSAIFGNDKGTITATKTCVVGNYDDDPTYAPTPIRSCPVIADPLAGALPVPSSSGCDFNGTKVNSKKSATLYPGVHCGGIDIGSSAVVTFTPGTYVIKNGQFKIGSSAQATGDGVFFYLISGNARFEFGSSAEINFKAPTSGPYQGILIWAAEALSNAHGIGSHSQSILQGTIYSPKTEIDIQCSGEVGASGDWTIWVVKQLQMSSHAHLKINSSYGASETPTPPGLLERLTPPSRVARLK